MPLVILALAALSLCLSVVAMRRDAPLEWRFALPAPLPVAGPARFETVLDYTVPDGQAHAPAIVAREGGFAVLWFQGSAEAQPDVDIYGVEGTRQAEGWRVSDPAPVVTRAWLARAFEPGQLVVTLGNTIENEGRAGHLYTTAVSVGGWAMAAIADVAMGPEGPRHARKLNLSPLLNRSYLVKSPMVAYEDGSHGLPAYFEMGTTYGALVRFDSRGRVRDQRRISAQGAKVIQPMIVPLDRARAIAFLRDFDRSDVLWLSHTKDGGRRWSQAQRTDLPNPSAPVAALGLGQGRVLMAANTDPLEPDAMILSLSEDEGETWRPLHRFDGKGSLRYPMLRRVGEDIVLSYSTGGKQGITAHIFNAAWVTGR
ncbi:exo-alpha-sialidase [uncultured Roseovarius sp.]|uniref:exo-alpha-sialidase n=1 Tax=uncultured Roseovarius sp. TaxID=293344 RepID=UPI0026084F0E|nr:exo-alpha-sialidase [uncultured Roseovarius sp.]